MVRFAPCNGPGSNQVGSLTAGGQNVRCMEQLWMELSDCQRVSNQVLRNPTGSLGAPTIMQLSHCDRNRHPPQYYRGAINWIHTCPICPMALSSTTYPPLLQVVSEAQAIPYSVALSVPTQPALPPTHPPLNAPLAYGVMRLPTGELPAATLPGLNGVVTKLDPIMWSNWSQPQTLGPATMASYPSPSQLHTANANEATT